MALWEVAFPVNYTSSGDLTRHAIEKHIKEIDKIYRHLNKLRNFSASSQAPLSPDNLRSMEVDSVTTGEQNYPGWNPQWLEAVAPGYLAPIRLKQRLGAYRCRAGRD